MSEIRYPSMSIQRYQRLQGLQMVMIEQSKKRSRELVREQNELDNDIIEGHVVIPRQRHLSNVESSNELLQRLKFYHGVMD